MNLKSLGMIAICVTAVGSASAAVAQSVRHDVMDARAAARDIRRLKVEMAAARRAHNWGKVAQDRRLIAADKHFLHRDVRTVIRHDGG
jgi:hypothetical protein